MGIAVAEAQHVVTLHSLVEAYMARYPNATLDQVENHIHQRMLTMSKEEVVAITESLVRDAIVGLRRMEVLRAEKAYDGRRGVSRKSKIPVTQGPTLLSFDVWEPLLNEQVYIPNKGMVAWFDLTEADALARREHYEKMMDGLQAHVDRLDDYLYVLQETKTKTLREAMNKGKLK